MNDLDRRTLANLNKEYEILEKNNSRDWWIDAIMLCCGIAIVVGMAIWNPMGI